MLEDGGVLLTWQLDACPAESGPFPIAARRIGDHRKAYLNYEGPVSGDRGTVTRVDSGTFEFLARTSGLIEIMLSGGKLAGPFAIRGAAGNGVLDRCRGSSRG